jgi:hypothetical protein
LKNFAALFFALILLVGCETKKSEVAEKANTPPFIKSVTILPQNPMLGSRINLQIEAGDNEGDNISYTVNWVLNGRIIGTGVEFFLNEAQKGDKIYAEITPSDGRLRGETVRTSMVTIANSPPKITGAKIEPDAIVSSTGELTIVAEGLDPNEDSLSYFCYWTLNRERLTDSSTTLPLEGFRLKKGFLLIAELYAYDGDTISSPYTLEIEIANSPPMLKPGWDSIPYRPDSIYYPLPIIDPDGDPLHFEILEAPKGIKIEEANGIIYGSVEDTVQFEILVRATDDEGVYLDAKFTLTPPSNF